MAVTDKLIAKYTKEVKEAEIDIAKARLELVIIIHKNKNYNLANYKDISEESQASSEVISDVNGRQQAAHTLYTLTYSKNPDSEKIKEALAQKYEYESSSSADNKTTNNPDPNYENSNFSSDVASKTANLYLAIEDYYSAKSNLDFYQSLDIPESDVKIKNPVKVPSQDEQQSIYPAVLVAETTNKLISYNNQLAVFISDVEQYETMLRASIEKGPGKVNVSWIAKIAEKFCRRINYWLAWLRYLLIKGLSGVYKKFQKVLGPIQSFYELAKGVNIDNIVSIFMNFLGFFNFPIQQFALFMKDFLKYTPPLATEAVSLVSSASKATEYGSNLVQEIKTITESTLNSDLDPAIIKRLYDKYAKDEINSIDLNIEFDSISISDIISGNPQKPKWEDYA